MYDQLETKSLPSADGSVSTALREEATRASRKEPGRRGLLQVLGLWFGISAAIGTTIAAGIVRTPGDIAQLLPDAFLFMAVWVVGGLYALCGASSLAELGAMIPRSGGQYNYSRRALGDYAGFIVGWSDWLSCCGTLAAVSIVVGEYSSKLLCLPSGMEKSVAIATILGFALMNSQGIKSGNMAQLFTAAMKTIAFVILVLACFFFSHPAMSEAAPSAGLTLSSGSAFFVNIILALQAVIYTIDGWNSVIYFGEEVKQPGRDVPRAIFGGVFTIMAIYLLLNASVLHVLPMNEIAGNKFCLGTVAQKIFGTYGDAVIRSIMVISLFSCINATQ
ncbi:MAG: APC family permease, partial [Candidatus Obscuribacterales bacterium]|nr:APC family permease [Candidatus Obscuribacterales bacterium]